MKLSVLENSTVHVCGHWFVASRVLKSPPTVHVRTLIQFDARLRTSSRQFVSEGEDGARGRATIRRAVRYQSYCAVYTQH